MTTLEAYLQSLLMSEQDLAALLSKLPDEALEAIANSAVLATHPASRIANVILLDRKRAARALLQRAEQYVSRPPAPVPPDDEPRGPRP
ncbi:hypothetical protein [Pseudoxanthomonas wuyuanensis]|uniref:Uncharacterized protein n=1 Tax=Pseudoxanthomonas wuyuanensis TaxID=1073196 RepID=A0A286D4R8_9GAMM|nr:hypothetical protein [Pseudoxanthomonas wuyuanensis]KAF1719792.1 hypothetical protein CSC75_13985 [Pseudoxanthomonas wuyuanensis]SOD53645.1 hypothetical protein SAMN06296416_102516 [Pseudoxanthomonas wuyuanensis]